MNGKGAVGAQPPADLDAVEPGHHDVEQDQVRGQLADGDEGLLAVGRGDDVVALRWRAGSAGS